MSLSFSASSAPAAREGSLVRRQRTKGSTQVVVGRASSNICVTRVAHNVASRTPPSRVLCSASSASSSLGAPSTVRVPTGARGDEKVALAAVEVVSAANGEKVAVGDVLPSSGRAIVPVLTQFGDFDSFELAQRLVDELPALDAAGVKVVAIGVGSVEAAKDFAAKTKFPIDRLYADEGAAACKALGFAPGWGREGGPGAWAAKIPFVNGYVKLLVMCAGIGSPGTLKEVIRGYTGDKDAPQVFNDGSNVDLSWKAAFNLAGGKGFQRPFELATFRLNNMIAILNDWEVLAPKDPDLLVQRGGALVLDGDEVLYRHDDQGILGYAPASRLVRKALAEDPCAIDPVSVCHEAAETRKVDSEEVYRAIVALEKTKEKNVSLPNLNGRWRLQWTTGTAKVSANVNRKGDGSYFPVRAEQSFDASSMRIRNGIYAGPISFFFDGPFKWDDQRRLLEFTFTRVSLSVGPFGPWSKDFSVSDWEATKAAEEKATDGQGKITSTKSSTRKTNPFFKIVLADGDVVAARGRGGGLALWQRVGEPVVAKE